MDYCGNAGGLGNPFDIAKNPDGWIGGVDRGGLARPMQDGPSQLGQAGGNGGLHKFNEDKGAPRRIFVNPLIAVLKST